MQKAINFVLDIIKWPLGVLMLFLILPALRANIVFLEQAVSSFSLLWFFIPMLGTLVFWFAVPGMSGSFLAIFEHEATHMLFAVLTGHTPQSIDVRQDVGGSFLFKGRGNWLIALSPYFFPTFAAIAMAASLLYLYMHNPIPDVYWTVLGVLGGYHIASTLSQIHPGQTDFKVANPLFTLIFLPGANLLTCGVLFAFGTMGWGGIRVFIQTLAEQVLLFLHVFM